MPSDQYQPAPIEVPPLYAWPPQPGAALRWLTIDLMAPWGFFWIALAVLLYLFATPDAETARNFDAGWIVALWLRNAAILSLVAGGLHWWFYIRASQGTDTKFIKKGLRMGSNKFLFKDQVLDNMTFSLLSGVTTWTLYEAATYWWYANEKIATPTVSESPLYFLLLLWGVFFWSTFHFYLNHRLLHTKALYKVAHERHHRNVVTGPWSGISMHPLEHFIYFTVFLIWWIVPAHPIVIILTGLFQGVSPAVSHCGYDYLKVSDKLKITTGDHFHDLHHRLFNVNFGNSTVPIDRLFNSWRGSRKPRSA